MGRRETKTLFAAALLFAWLPMLVFPQEGIPQPTDNGLARLFSLSSGQASAVQQFSARAVLAPPGASGPALSPDKDDFSARALTRDFLKDAGQIWSYPVHIQARDILPIAGLAALTGLIIANDEGIYRGFADYRDSHGWVRAVSPVITKMGTWGAWGTVAAFLGAGLIGGDKKSTETAVLATSAMVQSTILVGFIKGMTGRQRPEYAGGLDHWYGPEGFFRRFEKAYMEKYDSFPSGHTVTAFSLATVVAMQYQDTVWVPILSYTLATGVGLSRVTEDKHWLSDVLVGGVLGHVIGRMVVRNHRKRYHLMPTVGLDHGSLSFALAFSSQL